MFGGGRGHVGFPVFEEDLGRCRVSSLFFLYLDRSFAVLFWWFGSWSMMRGGSGTIWVRWWLVDA